MAAKRFKQQVSGESPYQPSSEASSAARHSSAPQQAAHRSARPATHSNFGRRPAAGTPRPAAGASLSASHPAARPAARPSADSTSAPRRAQRFADASRATASAHKFPHLGGTHDIRLASGEVPVTSSVGDGAGSFATDDAPRPIGVDPSETGSFSTIDARAGAVISDRKTAARAAKAARKAMPVSERKRVRSFRRSDADGSGVVSQASAPSHPMVIGIGVAALVVIILIVALIGSIISPSNTTGTGADAAATTSENVSTDQGVSLGGYTYSVSQGSDGVWSLMRQSGDNTDGSAVAIVSLSGTPVSVALHQDTLLVAENLSDGTWDVISYVAADGSTASQLLGSDGNPVTGQGELASSEVDGSNLVLTDTAGAKTTVPLG